MALNRYRVGTTVSISPSTVPAANGVRFTTPGAWSSLTTETFRRGQIVWADPVAGNGGAGALYTALTTAGAGLVAVTAADDPDHSAISN